MHRTLRVVVDTNVLVSGLLGLQNSPSAAILDAVRRQTIILVTSPQIINEVGQVLARDRIVERTHMNREEQESFITELIARCEVTVGAQLTKPRSRDYKDDKFLACAVEGNVDYIITGDRDLLTLDLYEGIRITTPRAFLEQELSS
jgi:putative PIN family toxin of toxin-antitoxin system